MVEVVIGVSARSGPRALTRFTHAALRKESAKTRAVRLAGVVVPERRMHVQALAASPRANNNKSLLMAQSSRAVSTNQPESSATFRTTAPLAVFFPRKHL